MSAEYLELVYERIDMHGKIIVLKNVKNGKKELYLILKL